jgi:hypothetical protein
MTASSTNDVLAEVWAIKDSLSASHGHSLKATCCALYAEQQKHPQDFVNLGATPIQNKPLQTTGRSRKAHVGVAASATAP